MPSNFTILGAGLAMAGAALSLTSYFVLDFVPITALGLSVIIVAAVSFALGMGQPRIPPDISSMLLESGLENTAALVEELGLGSKAIYLPPSITEGRHRALLTISPGEAPKMNQQLPNRLIVRYGQLPDSMGILVSTLGSTVLQRYGQDLSGADLGGALSSILKGFTDLSDGVRVAENGARIKVEIINPRIEFRRMQVFENLGSPLASIVASAASQVMNAQVRIMSEEISGNRQLVLLDVERQQ
jgi:hypothetical protein